MLIELHVTTRHIQYTPSRMHSVRIHGVINQMISVAYRLGIWYRGDVPTARETRIGAFYFFYNFLFFAAMTIGAITSENIDECIFLAEASIVLAVLLVKLYILIRKQKQILSLLNRICAFTIRDYENVGFFNDKLRKFTTFLIAFVWITIFCSYTVGGIVPFVGSKRSFIANFAFPLDYKNDEFAFWIAYIFLISQITLTITVVALSTVFWYLMFNCSLRYEILGKEIRNTGRSNYDDGKKKMSEQEKHEMFFQDLTGSIDAHVTLNSLIDEMESFVSDLFLVQFGTSGMCICGSIYCLAFYISANNVERLFHIYSFFYHISELYLITYFGNEIMLTSGRLTYCLFESDWIEQPQSTKKCIIIFGEYLKRPRQLLFGKLYPLTLETFTRILDSAYKLFNILKNLKK